MLFVKIISIFLALFLSSVVCADKYVLVEENKAKINHGNVSYVLNTYIVMFEQPYYITVEREDGEVVNLDAAEKMALKYIQPRGCTEPLERRGDLDQKNEEQTKVVIGVAC